MDGFDAISKTFKSRDPNQGDVPTYCSARRLEMFDITFRSSGLLESFKGWEVSSDPSLLDHRHTLFTLQDSVPASLIRNPTGANWDSF
jgi:hypothetical protein